MKMDEEPLYSWLLLADDRVLDGDGHTPLTPVLEVTVVNAVQQHWEPVTPVTWSSAKVQNICWNHRIQPSTTQNIQTRYYILVL